MLPVHQHVWLWILNLLLLHTTMIYCDECERRSVDYKLLKDDTTNYMTELYCVNITFETFSTIQTDESIVTITYSYMPILNKLYSTDRKYVSILNMSNNAISKIMPLFFQSFFDLSDLNLSSNNISNVGGGLFYSLRSLKKLNLSFNIIDSLNEHSFIGLENLFVIDLSKNQIQHVPFGLFEGQIKLIEIYINDNKLTSFNSDLFSHLDILYFNLSNNNINFESGQNSKPNIKYLYIANISLGNNNLEKLPNFCNFSFLTKLDISFNNISTINASTFKDLSNLKELYLNDNLLGYFGNGTKNWLNIFWQMKQLQNVSLENNYWKCSDLEEVVQTLLILHVAISPEHRYHDSNFLGISCSDQDEKSHFFINQNDTDRIITHSFSNDALKELSEKVNNLDLQFENITSSIDEINFKIDYANNQTSIEFNKIDDKFRNNSMMQIKIMKKANDFMSQNIKSNFSDIHFFNNTALKLTTNKVQSMESWLKNLTNQYDKLRFKIDNLAHEKLEMNDKRIDDDSMNLLKEFTKNISLEIKEINFKINLTSNSPIKQAAINAEKLTQSKNEDTNSGLSNILNNILLFALLCVLIYFCYLVQKKRLTVRIQDEINLE